jgi:phage terminase large subunit
MQLDIQIPEKAAFLFEPYDFKVLYGGRGSAKSHSVARALLALGAQRTLRIVCVREVQKNIADSSYKLLKDLIRDLDLGSDYNVRANDIQGRNGTEFIFRGLGNMTAEGIKSLEGADIVWVEEARTVSANSWDFLVPTVRKDGSEIWITYNPDQEDDPVDVRFRQFQSPRIKAISTRQRRSLRGGPGACSMGVGWRLPQGQRSPDPARSLLRACV